MATLELERTQVLGGEKEAQKHNAMIAERYRRLQDAEADQFAESYLADEPVRASVIAPEKPVFVTPTVETPATEQTPQVTEFVRTRIESPVFTTEKFDNIQETTADVSAPVEIAIPTQATALALEEQYSLSHMAKAVLAAFVATVLLMLTLICVNTQIIRIKSVRVQDLEQQKERLAQDIAELQSRIQAAQSEEAIREYALSNGMILGNN